MLVKAGLAPLGPLVAVIALIDAVELEELAVVLGGVRRLAVADGCVVLIA